MWLSVRQMAGGIVKVVEAGHAVLHDAVSISEATQCKALCCCFLQEDPIAATPMAESSLEP